MAHERCTWSETWLASPQLENMCPVVAAVHRTPSHFRSELENTIALAIDPVFTTLPLIMIHAGFQFRKSTFDRMLAPLFVPLSLPLYVVGWSNLCTLKMNPWNDFALSILGCTSSTTGNPSRSFDVSRSCSPSLSSPKGRCQTPGLNTLAYSSHRPPSTMKPCRPRPVVDCHWLPAS